LKSAPTEQSRLNRSTKRVQDQMMSCYYFYCGLAMTGGGESIGDFFIFDCRGGVSVSMLPNRALSGFAWMIMAVLIILPVGCSPRSDSTATDAEPAISPKIPPAQHKPFFQAGFAYSRIGGNYNSDVSSRELGKMHAAGGNVVQFLAFAYIYRLDAPKIATERERSDRMLRGGILRAQAAGLHTMLKLQMWGPGFQDGKFSADISMNGVADWKAFMANYRLYVLHQAHLAAETGVDIFCIGTELAQASRSPAITSDWRALIGEVRSIYPGPLTYAAHHDEVEGVPFWDDLDYIGIDGYYAVARLPAALDSLERLSKRWNRPVIFTEAGFASSSYALTEPWRPGPTEASPDSVRLDLQAEAWQALLAELWRRDFVWGVYVWKWHPNLTWGGPTNADHTPQGKPALDVIRRFFTKLPRK
jgi:hypothetical protein